MESSHMERRMLEVLTKILRSQGEKNLWCFYCHRDLVPNKQKSMEVLSLDHPDSVLTLLSFSCTVKTIWGFTGELEKAEVESSDHSWCEKPASHARA